MRRTEGEALYMDCLRTGSKDVREAAFECCAEHFPALAEQLAFAAHDEAPTDKHRMETVRELVLVGNAAAMATDLVESLDRSAKWRLILGKTAQSSLAALGQSGGALLDGPLLELDAALDVIYENQRGEDGAAGGGRSAGLGKSAPKLARWLGDIRKYFPREVVAVIQEDAIERRGLKQLLFEPETLGQVTPTVELAATILSLKGLIPEQTRRADLCVHADDPPRAARGCAEG